jgi:hypothetical protein
MDTVYKHWREAVTWFVMEYDHSLKGEKNYRCVKQGKAAESLRIVNR